MTVTVLLADDHAVVRDGLRALLEVGDLQVVAVAGNGREAVAEALRLKPDIVIMDIAMPELDGVEATRRIVEKCPETRVLILSMYLSAEPSTAPCRRAPRLRPEGIRGRGSGGGDSRAAGRQALPQPPHHRDGDRRLSSRRRERQPARQPLAAREDVLQLVVEDAPTPRSRRRCRSRPRPWKPTARAS